MSQVYTPSYSRVASLSCPCSDDTLDAPGGQIVLLDRHPPKTGVQTCGCVEEEVLVDTASLIALTLHTRCTYVV